MMAKAMTGVETARTQSRVREVMELLASARFEPLYGIDRTTVDPQLEVELRRPGGGGAHPAHFRARLNRLTPLDAQRQEVAVERVVVGTMVQDDQRAEPRIPLGIPHRSAVDGADGGALGGGDFHPAPHQRSALTA